MLDVCPCRNDGGEDHQTEGEERHAGDGATEPEDFTVCDQDDGQVLEDRVHWDRKELERFCRGVDHANKEKGDGEPCVCQSLSCSSQCASISHLRASSLLKSLNVMTPAVLQVVMAATQTTLC